MPPLFDPAFRNDAGPAFRGDAGLAERLHDAVDEVCFIARSVNFPVRHQPTTVVAG